MCHACSITTNVEAIRQFERDTFDFEVGGNISNLPPKTGSWRPSSQPARIATKPFAFLTTVPNYVVAQLSGSYSGYSRLDTAGDAVA